MGIIFSVVWLAAYGIVNWSAGGGITTISLGATGIIGASVGAIVGVAVGAMVGAMVGAAVGAGAAGVAAGVVSSSSSPPQATMITLNASTHTNSKDIFQSNSLRGKVKITTPLI